MTARWFFTVHALDRMAEMGVDRVDVLATLDSPHVDAPDLKNGRGRRRAFGPVLVVPYDGDVVLTVLWRSDEPFERPAKAC